MSTFPLAHSSSPAVVKVSNTSPTIATAAFDPPARVALVVGVTSDADTNAGAAPTLTAISGLTWTRVGPALGFSATGDVGVVALFQGVLDNPDTDLGSITVTANVGISVLKPKMLVVRVYDETQVDISDPLGAIASGSFATSASFLGTVTPETSDGGLRGLWLDWNATGTPTVILPNNDNAEIVDTYHNAGLSTNGQIGRRNRTVAGVAQSLGVNLLAASSDGNWLVYELRSPQPAAASTFDSSAFSSAAFATIGGSSGAETGTLSASVPRATSSLIGATTIPSYAGTTSAPVPRATASLTGTATAPAYTGTLSASAPVVTASMSGTATVPAYAGSIAAATPLPTASMSGTVAAPAGYTGTLSASTPPVTGSMTGAVTAPIYAGTVSAAVSKTTGSITGTATPPNFPGTLAAAVPPTRATITGTVTNPAGSGTLSGTVPRVTGSMSGAVTAPVWTGTLAAQLARTTATMLGTATGPVSVGTLAATLPKPTASLTGTSTSPVTAGTLSATTPRLAAVLSGTFVADPTFVAPELAATPLPPTHLVASVPARFTVNAPTPAAVAATVPPRYTARSVG